MNIPDQHELLDDTWLDRMPPSLLWALCTGLVTACAIVVTLVLRAML